MSNAPVPFYRKVYALQAEVREQVCHHEHAHWTGRVPMTGRYACRMCGIDLEPGLAPMGRCLCGRRARHVGIFRHHPERMARCDLHEWDIRAMRVALRIVEQVVSERG